MRRDDSVHTLAAAGLLTVSYHHVWFSQNARAYTALLFFTLIATTLCLRMCRAPLVANRRTTLVYAGVMTLPETKAGDSAGL